MGERKLMFAIRQGVDIVDIRRINKIYNVYGKKFEKKIFSDSEIKDLNLNNKIKKRRIEKISGRFALKEALSKAVGTGFNSKLSYRDINIIDESTGAPKILLNQSLKKIIKKKKFSISCSVSHEKNYAIGVVTILTQ
jgi:holo-[acyl-carrier-protein] synthase